MFENLFKNIDTNTDIRQSLIDLRQQLKKEEALRAFRKISDEKLALIADLLQHEDAKVRKNAALILGELGKQQFIEKLFESYMKEDKLFVKSSYLTAMSKLDYRTYVDRFKARISELTQVPMTDENKKHLSEELKILRDMVLTLEGHKKHGFTGANLLSEVILLTSPGLEQVTFDQLLPSTQEVSKILPGGILVKTNHVRALLGIRTVKGVLFRFCRNPLARNDYESVAKALLQSGLVKYVAERLDGKAPYYFRIDMKTKLVLDEKGQYIKRLAMALEQGSGHQIQNSASNYEFEIRIMENKKGQYSAYLKFATLKDDRFDYRKHAIGTSMHPVRAAEVVALAGEYLQKDAIILDPFCGTGTLLIERNKAVRARSTYGVDIFGEAIEMGRENAQLAGYPIHFVNRDFADFTHEYPFDEIITELPAVSDKMPPDALYSLYRIFIRRLQEWMRTDGYVIVLTTQEDWMKKLVSQASYLKTEAVYHLSGKRPSAVMVLQVTE